MKIEFLKDLTVSAIDKFDEQYDTSYRSKSIINADVTFDDLKYVNLLLENGTTLLYVPKKHIKMTI